MKLLAVLGALGAAAWLAACSPQRFVASPDDYRDYRRVRTALTLGGRLRAAEEYLKARPKGAFAEELKALFDEEEARYFESAKTSQGGTLEYLTFLPSGPHADAAHSLLVAWNMRIEEGEGVTLLAEARRTEARLAGAQLQRQLVGETIFEGLKAIGDLALYNRTRETLPEPAKRFLAGSGGATWGPMPISTTRDLFFVIPTNLERESRLATLTLSLVLDGARVRRARLSGPDLYVHWLEADAMVALDPADPAQRRRANAHATERLAGFFEGTFPGERCAGARAEARAAEVLLERACDGFRVRVAAGTGLGDDDVIEVARTTP